MHDVFHPMMQKRPNVSGLQISWLSIIKTADCRSSFLVSALLSNSCGGGIAGFVQQKSYNAKQAVSTKAHRRSHWFKSSE